MADRIVEIIDGETEHRGRRMDLLEGWTQRRCRLRTEGLMVSIVTVVLETCLIFHTLTHQMRHALRYGLDTHPGSKA